MCHDVPSIELAVTFFLVESVLPLLTSDRNLCDITASLLSRTVCSSQQIKKKKKNEYIKR